MSQQNRNQKSKGCKWWDQIYQIYDEYLCKFISGPIFGSIVLLLSAGEKQILKTLFWGEMGNIFLPGVVMIKSWGRVLLQGMSKQTKFFDLQMYFPVIITP